MANPGLVAGFPLRSAPEAQVAAVVRRLSGRVGGSVPVAVIEDQVQACFAQWSDVPVRDYLPILVERAVRRQLDRRQAAVPPVEAHPA